ncbi:hypothetical protein LTR78_007615 [Recurvomyces mirabilis]|uniref:Major facilitator superfamily (MFS) profile domain-containing protein n=1 Tax=Recurvomyces mirabilis TaxID=574656 RepID=A0AAE0TS68_9PEZI|nr:hypothetical protein LTR78_007615 [Recurvomyces mirabilis]
MGLGGVQNFASVAVVRFLLGVFEAGAFGGAIAFGVGHMNQVGGLSAWRWLFILEGIPSVLSSLLVLFFLPDYPETAKWLSESEKQLAVDRLRVDGSHGQSVHLTWTEAKATLCD